MWGFEKSVIECEKFHRTYLRYILNLRGNTCNAMVYGESGRFPLDIIVKKRMIGFWARILTGKSSKLVKLLYNRIINSNANVKWVVHIKHILENYGMSDVWENQDQLFVEGGKGAVNWIKSRVENRLRDQFIQQWRSDLDSHSSCYLYKEYKTKFVCEKYLINLSVSNRIALCKLRTNNDRLAIVVGRHRNNRNDIIPREQRYCNLCESQDIGDEFHLIYRCTNSVVVDCRNKFIKKYCYRPNMHECIKFLSSDNDKTIFNLSQFLKRTLPLL